MSDLSKPVRSTIEAIRALKLGQVNAFENTGVVMFTIVMDHAPSATEHRLKKFADRVEAHGYRVTSSNIFEATLRVTCRPSFRNIGRVERAANDGDDTILLLGGTINTGVWTVPKGAAKDRRVLLLTQPGDEVVIWRDLDHEGKPGRVSAFHNRTLPALG